VVDVASQLGEALPVSLNGLNAVRRELRAGVRDLALEPLHDRDEARCFQLGQVTRQIALRQPRQPLEEQELRLLA
jgi:hypothetical protein